MLRTYQLLSIGFLYQISLKNIESISQPQIKKAQIRMLYMDVGMALEIRCYERGIF